LGQREKRSVAAFDEEAFKPSITSASVDAGALLDGNLLIDISFKSPFDLKPVMPGFVLYNDLNVAVFGSNPRIHREGFVARTLRHGTVRFESYDLPLVEGTYTLSFWLGDWHRDYDHRDRILSIDFRPRKPLARILPHSSTDGSLNWSGLWRTEIESIKEPAVLAGTAGSKSALIRADAAE
jgi:hypothetical protein